VVEDLYVQINYVGIDVRAAVALVRFSPLERRARVDGRKQGRVKGILVSLELCGATIQCDC